MAIEAQSQNIEVQDAPRTKKYADSHTPLVRNCWYVAATSDEITRTLSSKWILGENILFYRSEAGEVVALDNRCPHRSFPLSMGSLQGDNVVCGYHGITYNSKGACTLIPAVPRVPSNFGLRHYAIVERGPVVWIWMGNADQADPAQIPDYFPRPGAEGWGMVSGYYHVKSDYVAMHENLQDLTHFSYLHATSLGAPDFANAPLEIKTEGNSVWTLRTHLNAKAPALWTKAFNLPDDAKLSRIIESNFLTPGHIGALQTMKVSPHGPDGREEFQVSILHFLTPDTQNSFHYYWFHLRNFAQQSDEMGRILSTGYSTAFLEDKVALEAITEMRLSSLSQSPVEHSFAGDRPGLAVRRVIQKLSDQESSQAH